MPDLPDLPDLPDSARAMVLTGVRQLELQTFPLPQIGPDDGLLRMEVCGICGSDYEQYNGEFSPRFPTIPGHEPVGRIAALGDRARERWGRRGGRPGRGRTGRALRCLRRLPRRARRTLPRRRRLRVTPSPTAPRLSGAATPSTCTSTPPPSMHLMPPDLPPRMRRSTTRWAPASPGPSAPPTCKSDSPSSFKARDSAASAPSSPPAPPGAGQIIVTGLPRDEHKLALARDLGADLAIEVDSERPEQLIEAVLNATNGARRRCRA